MSNISIHVDASFAPTAPHIDGRIAHIARRQHGLIATHQVASSPAARRSLSRRAATGQLEHIRQGVWRIAGSPSTWEQSALAAVLSSGPASVLSHRAAARIWQYEGWSTSSVEITKPNPLSSRITNITCHRSTVLDIDRRIRNSLPVTSPERTAIDLSGRLGVVALGKFVDDGIRRGILDINRLSVCASRLAPARGRKMSNVYTVLQRRLDGYEPGESVFEDRVADVIANLTDLPPLVRQFEVRIGDKRYRIDLSNPAILLAHECDGFKYHKTRSAFSNDRARANDLVGLGWTVLRYTTDMTDCEIARYATDAYGRANERLTS